MSASRNNENQPSAPGNSKTEMPLPEQENNARPIEPASLSLYEQPYDTEFPINFTDGVKQVDYEKGEKGRRSRRLNRAFNDYCGTLQPPAWAHLFLVSLITGHARALNPVKPKLTRPCFVSSLGPNMAHRVHELHAEKLRLIHQFFPQEEFPELYPLILRYFVHYHSFF